MSNPSAKRRLPIDDASDRAAAERLRHAAASTAKGERDLIEARLEEADLIARQREELIAHQDRVIHEQAARIVALQTSLSWRVTRVRRFVAKAMNVIRRGPRYWRHVYTVRAQVIENWRREGRGPDVSPLPALRRFESDAETVRHRIASRSHKPLTPRATDALKRARITAARR